MNGTGIPRGAGADLFAHVGDAAPGNPNASEVLHLSPFRYPGGKAWFVPEAKAWMRGLPRRPGTLVEPFAGGASVGLNAVARGLVDRLVLVEIDPGVAAVWQTVLHGPPSDMDALCGMVRDFGMSRERLEAALDRDDGGTVGTAFRTLLRNRTSRDGNLSPGAGLVRGGEAGRGVASRWYPASLVRRMRSVRAMAGRITFRQGDAFEAMRGSAGDGDAAYFVDPPYTAGGRKVGARLYAHSEVDHPALFATVASLAGPAMLTYDDVPEVHELAGIHGFAVAAVPMSGSQRRVKWEVVATKPGI